MDRPTLVALIIFGLIGWGAWALWRRMRSDFDREFEAIRQAAQAAANIPAPSAQPVLVSLPGRVNWTLTNWGVAAVLLALALWSEPAILWTRWLAWPAGVLLLPLGGTMVFAGWKGPDRQLQVDPSGLQLSEHQRDGSLRLLQQATWSQVRSVQLRRNPNVDGPRTDHLAFELADGQNLVSVPVPFKGDAEWQRLMDSLPPWSGRAIESVRRL